MTTLCGLREKMLEQTEKEAKDLALELELFTSGSLDAFVIFKYHMKFIQKNVGALSLLPVLGDTV